MQGCKYLLHLITLYNTHIYTDEEQEEVSNSEDEDD